MVPGIGSLIACRTDSRIVMRHDGNVMQKKERKLKALSLEDRAYLGRSNLHRQDLHLPVCPSLHHLSHIHANGKENANNKACSAITITPSDMQGNT